MATGHISARIKAKQETSTREVSTVCSVLALVARVAPMPGQSLGVFATRATGSAGLNRAKLRPTESPSQGSAITPQPAPGESGGAPASASVEKIAGNRAAT